MRNLRNNEDGRVVSAPENREIYNSAHAVQLIAGAIVLLAIVMLLSAVGGPVPL